MSRDAAQTFARYAASYDADRRRLIPCFEEFYGAGLRLIAATAQGRPLRILDLGAGTGLMSAFALDHLNIAEICLLDGAPEMLDRAKDRLASVPQARFRVANFASDDLGGTWDAVISALAIHHLSHGEKRALFARILQSLKPNGWFVNAEQVAGPSPAMDQQYRDFWDQDIRAAGIDDAGVAAAADRMSHDICAPVEDQLEWMRNAGFQDVDCLMKSWRFAVLSGRRPPGT